MTIDQSLFWFAKDFEKLKGITWFKPSDIIYIPNILLQAGYSVRPARAGNDGNLCKEDRRAWVTLQKHDLDPATLPRRLLVTKADGVFFAEYNGNPVGCVCVVTVSEEMAGLHMAVVLRRYRRKGLYKAMLGCCLRFCIEQKFKWIHIVPAKILFNYWKRVIPSISKEIATG